MSQHAGTGFFLPKTYEDAKDKRRRNSSQGRSGRASNSLQLAPITSLVPARYSLVDGAVTDGACLLQLGSPPPSICSDLDTLNSSSGASFSTCLNAPFMALSNGDSFPLTPCHSSGGLGVVTPTSSQAVGQPVGAWPMDTARLQAAVPQQQCQQQGGPFITVSAGDSFSSATCHSSGGQAAVPTSQVGSWQPMGVWDSTCLAAAPQAQGAMFASPQQQQQQLLLPTPQPCYGPVSSDGGVAAAAGGGQGLQEMLLLQQQAELDSTISRLMTLRQQLTAIRSPAKAPAPAPVLTGPPFAPVGPPRQQFVLVPMSAAPAAALTANQAAGNPALFAAQLELEPHVPAAVAAGGGAVSLVQLQQQAADLELQAQVARMLSLL